MKYTGILEKLECIFKLIGNSIIYPIFLAFISILIILLITKKLKNKKCLFLIIISYIILFTTVIINNSQNLIKVFDNISTNLFTNIYFPSAYTYFFSLIIIDIITIKSILNFKEEKVYKITNSIYFFTIQFIFALIMELVGKNNIDIFTKKSLFSNKILVILLESSINVFILWLVSLLIIYITNKIVEIINIRANNLELAPAQIIDINNDEEINKIPTTTISNDLVIENTPDINIKDEEVIEPIPAYNNNEINTPVTQFIDNINTSPMNINTTYNDSTINNDILSNSTKNIPVYDEIYNNNEINTPVTQFIDNINTNPMNIDITYEDSITDNNILFNNTIDDTFSLNDLIFSKQNTITEENNEVKNHISSDELLDQLLNNGLPIIHEKEEIEHKEKKEDYTLNDYRIFNKILKDIRETNNSNVISINKELELKLMNKYTEDEYNLFKMMLKEYSN